MKKKKIDKNDRRFLVKMRELNELNGMTYSKLSERLNAKGFKLTHLEVFSIAARRTEADIKLQEAIADILGCLRKDIF